MRGGEVAVALPWSCDWRHNGAGHRAYSGRSSATAVVGPRDLLFLMVCVVKDVASYSSMA